MKCDCIYGSRVPVRPPRIRGLGMLSWLGGIVQHRAVFLRFNRIDLEAGPRWPDAGIRPVACPTEVLQRR